MFSSKVGGYNGFLIRWDSGVKYLACQPKYRKMALEYAETEGMLDEVKKTKKRNKEFIKMEEERIIKQVLEENMDIRGGYAKPKVTDVLWVQLVFLPYTLSLYLAWYFRWIWRFRVKGEEYGDEEKLYLVRKYLGLSETQFEVRNHFFGNIMFLLRLFHLNYFLIVNQGLSEIERDEFMDKELWKKENFVVSRHLLNVSSTLN